MEYSAVSGWKLPALPNHLVWIGFIIGWSEYLHLHEARCYKYKLFVFLFAAMFVTHLICQLQNTHQTQTQVFGVLLGCRLNCCSWQARELN